MILILSTTQGHGFGSEKVLCELLSGWKPDGQKLAVVAPKGSAVTDCAKCNGIDFFEISAGRDAIVANISSFMKIWSSLPDFNLVHAWSARCFEVGVLAGMKKEVGVSGTLHDHPYASYHGGMRRAVMKYSVNRFQALACVSESVAAACRQSAYRSPLKVIHNGLNDVQVSGNSNKGPLRIGFLGMNAAGKGFSLLTDWILHLHEQNIVWQLYGDALPALEVEAKKNQSEYGSDKIILRGRQHTEDIFSEIDILVHASTRFDSLPTVLIEAARAGIPVVASDFGGAKEIVEDGVTGYLFNPQSPNKGLEGLRKLTESKGLRDDFGVKARLNYERRFRIEKMVDSYHDFWCSMM